MSTGDGYYVDVKASESCVDALNGVAKIVTAADADLAAMSVPPTPGKGEGIGPAVTTFTSAWHDALPKIATEFTNLAAKVHTVKDVTVTTEKLVHDRFHRFAN